MGLVAADSAHMGERQVMGLEAPDPGGMRTRQVMGLEAHDPGGMRAMARSFSYFSVCICRATCPWHVDWNITAQSQLPL